MNDEQKKAEAAWVRPGLSVWVLTRLEQGDRGDEAMASSRVFVNEADARVAWAHDSNEADDAFPGSDLDWEGGLNESSLRLVVDAGVVDWLWTLERVTLE